MKVAVKALGLFVVLSVAFLGCTQSGYLNVENNTNGPVAVSAENDDVELDAGEDESFEYEFPGFLLNLIQQESESIDIEYVGMFVFEGEDTVEVEAGDDIDFEIDADGGAIFVENNSSASIVGVWLKPASSSTWSNNLIDGYAISPGQFAFWTVGPGSWNIDVYDSDGYYPNPAAPPQNDVAVDMATTFTWNDGTWTFNGVQGTRILGADPKVMATAEEMADFGIQPGAE
jgi:hypothetical protein